jgi:hypothetical protein
MNGTKRASQVADNETTSQHKASKLALSEVHAKSPYLNLGAQRHNVFSIMPYSSSSTSLDR